MRDVILSILSGLAAAVLGGLVTVFVQFRDWKKREAQSQADLNQQLAVLVEQQKQFQLTFDQRDRELRQRESLLQREMEYQARETLRQCYRQVLESQRRCRQACLRLAKAGGAEPGADLAAEAAATHGEFIDAYHALNLDSTEAMWKEARGLRDVLDDMLEYATAGRSVDKLGELARDARQNLERTFRKRLDQQPLQRRRPLGEPYDKVVRGKKDSRVQGPIFELAVPDCSSPRRVRYAPERLIWASSATPALARLPVLYRRSDFPPGPWKRMHGDR